jgi:serine/threonine protein kinase
VTSEVVTSTRQAGRRFGKYELVRRIATGGMAEIYLARVRGFAGFEKVLVVKKILPEHAADDDFVRMFVDEARLAATLRHPNIAEVYDLGRIDDDFFFTMEYVHGADLLRIMDAAYRGGRRLPLERTLSIVAGIAAGLHHAHERVREGRSLRIVHRDVSPSNVLVSYDGSVKLADFGIARAIGRWSMTRVGTVRGKRNYMSPEQCRGESLDRRSDIYSLGIVLYELTTGQRLFPESAEAELQQQVATSEVIPPSRRVRAYPRELEPIVLKALRRRKEERYATAQELQVAIEDYARERRLNLSSVALAQYMEGLFGKQVEEWRRAEQSGVSLGDYLASSTLPCEVPDDVALIDLPSDASLAPLLEGTSAAVPAVRAPSLPTVPARPSARLARGGGWGAPIAAAAIAFALGLAGLWAGRWLGPRFGWTVRRSPEIVTVGGVPGPSPLPIAAPRAPGPSRPPLPVAVPRAAASSPASAPGLARAGATQPGKAAPLATGEPEPRPAGTRKKGGRPGRRR